MEVVSEEIVALKQFREMVEDLLPLMSTYQRDDILLRFLRARDLDLEKAEAMLKKSLEWRKQNDIDNILKIQLPKELEERFPVTVCGLAHGIPIVLAKCGTYDFKYTIQECEMREEFITYIVQFFEQATKFCEHLTTSPGSISQAYMIIDAHGFVFRQVTCREVISAVVKLIKIFEGNYPEMLRTAFVINVPTIFQLMWNFIRNMLTARTISKIRILTGKNEWQREIFKIIDADNFPSEYGGAITTCIDYKLRLGFNCFPTYDVFPDEEFTTVCVKAGQKFPVDVTVDKRQELRFNFCTIDQSGDIGFSVQFEDTQTVVKYCRVDSHLHLQKGIICCTETGRYTLTFDNSFSTFKTKTVKYAFRTTHPDQKIGGN